MTRYTAPLITLLILALSAPLGGCDATAKLTEQEHIQRAKDFEDMGNLMGSIIELKNAIQKNPDSPQARLLLGQVYLKANMGSEAEKELTQAVKLGVSKETIKPQLGEALLLMGEYKRVIDEIQPGNQTSKVHLARVLQIRGDALLKLGQVKEACGLFQQSLDTGIEQPETYWGLANCAIAERDTPKAEKWLDAALKTNAKQAKTWAYRGDLARLLDNAQGALVAYTNALKSEPNNLEALERRTDTYLALGQIEPAQKDLKQILLLAPKSVSAHYLKAALSFQQAKYPEARDALLEVFKINANHPPSLLLAGKTAYALGAYQQAEGYMNRALALAPAHMPTRKALASIQIKQNQYDKALETLSPLLAAHTQDPQALALAGEAAVMAKDHPKAMNYLGQALVLDPENTSIRTRLAALHLAAGNSEKALSDLELAASQNAKPSKADFTLVMLHMQRKEYDKALQAIAALEKKLPNNPATYNLRAGALIGKNDRVGARKAYEQALAIQADFTPALFNLAQFDLMDGQTNTARKRFERILKIDPQSLDAMLAMARISLREKNENAYLNWLRSAIKAHPKEVQAHTAMIQYWLSKNDTDKALNVARELVNSNPDNPDALNLLGTTQLATGDRANAINTFTTLTKKASQSPDAYLKLALAQIADKNLTQARASLQKALQISPGQSQTQETLLNLELADNKPEAALRIARQIQKNQPSSARGFKLEADVHFAQKNLPQTIKNLELALSKDAGSNELIKLHQAHVLAGSAKKSEPRLQSWLKQRPTDNLVRAQLAEYFMLGGMNKEAIAQYLEIQKQKPDNVVVLNNLATLYQRENDPRALATAEQAFKLFPNNPSVQDTLGWILVERGQAQRGLGVLQQALLKSPDNATIRYHHALALAKTGNIAQARKDLAKLLEDTHVFPEAAAATMLLKSL